MSLLRPIAAAALLLFAFAAPSQAQPLWFQFTGTTAGLPGELEFLGGKRFIATFRLDPTKLDGDPVSPVSGVYYGAVTAGRLEIVLDSEQSMFWTVNLTPEHNKVVVHNRPVGEPDYYAAYAGVAGPLGSDYFIVELLDREGTAFNSKNFPTSLNNFGDFEQRTLGLNGLNGQNGWWGLVETFEIVPGLDLTDTDADSIPDEADNCPALPNANQSDVDLDLLGDVCDPFPNDSDNEKAQCSVDLSLCSANLAASESERIACAASLATATSSLTVCSANLATVQAALAAATTDSDGDGLPNQFDRCPGTASGAAIDTAGCSVQQFCGAVVITTKASETTCTTLDWLNDEPTMTSKQADCRVDRVQKRCVPSGS